MSALSDHQEKRICQQEERIPMESGGKMNFHLGDMHTNLSDLQPVEMVVLLQMEWRPEPVRFG